MSTFYARLLCSAIMLAVTYSANGTPPPPPDPGLKGLQAVHLFSSQIVNKGTRYQTIDMSDPCGDISGLFVKAGLPIVKNVDDNPAVGSLFLNIERAATQEAGALYLVEITLSQDMRLVRDPDRKLSVPVTYRDRHYGLVTAATAKEKTCEELRAMVTDFLKLWQGWNGRD
jgi:hypothetical protein